MEVREVMTEVGVECRTDLEDIKVEAGKGWDIIVAFLNVGLRITGPEIVTKGKKIKSYD